MKPLILPGKEKPYLMAHRGNRILCPENTLASFRQALQDGADLLETDLHLTADNVFVCIHDETLDRTTDAAGPVKDRNPGGAESGFCFVWPPGICGGTHSHPGRAGRHPPAGCGPGPGTQDR